MSYTNSFPKYKTTLKPKTTPLFLSRMTQGKSLRGCHLVITGKASIVLIITILIRRSLWRKRWKGSETTKKSLSSCYMTDTSVHLTHLISERVKVSIHALKLCHDGLEGHTTSRRRRSRGGKNLRVLCENIARVHKWDMRKSNTLTHNHNCLMGTITFEVHPITLTSPRNTLATIFQSILILFAFVFLCIYIYIYIYIYFLFEHSMHEHIRERKEIPN